MGIIGAIAVPLWSGTFKQAWPDTPVFYFEDDRDRFFQKQGGTLDGYVLKVACLNRPIIRNPDILKICLDSEAVPRANSTLKTSFDRDRLFQLILEMLLGLVVIATFMLLILKAVKAYTRWLTSSN